MSYSNRLPHRLVGTQAQHIRYDQGNATEDDGRRRHAGVTGALVLGAVPLALAIGAGAESRIQIGWVIVGGMSFGTLLTLFVVPSYTFLVRKKGAPAATIH